MQERPHKDNNHIDSQNGRTPRSEGRPPPSRHGSPAAGPQVIGYASCLERRRENSHELRQQTTLITRECARRGLRLLEVVAEPAGRKALDRPGLAYALDRLRTGDAQGLIVAELSRITYSAAELGTIVEWFTRFNARLVDIAHDFDTDREEGRLAAAMLVEVSRWERTRLSAQTRKGLRAARLNGKSSGRGSVADNPDLSERISQMRAEGMTLQAIADRLNEEGVPTVRGGAKWRHSSVQAAAGYRRRPHPLPDELPSSQPSADSGGPVFNRRRQTQQPPAGGKPLG